MLTAREKHQLKIARKIVSRCKTYSDSYNKLIMGLTVGEAERIIKKLGEKGKGK